MLSPLPPMDYDELDLDIRAAVRILRDHGIVTFESCQGGPGHSRDAAFIKFGGNLAEAMYAMAVVLFDPSHGLRPLALQQVWMLNDGFPDGPHWELTFFPREGFHR